MRWHEANLFRALVLTFLAALAAVSVALANRNVYTRLEVDGKIQAIHRELDYIHQDVQWLVRQQGGIPSANANADHYPSQPDTGR